MFMTTYKIVRHYQRGFQQEVLKTGLTLEEAQAHCNDPETCDKTCTRPENVQRTAEHGPWFDGYYRES